MLTSIIYGVGSALVVIAAKASCDFTNGLKERRREKNEQKENSARAQRFNELKDQYEEIVEKELDDEELDDDEEEEDTDEDITFEAVYRRNFANSEDEEDDESSSDIFSSDYEGEAEDEELSLDVDSDEEEDEEDEDEDEEDIADILSEKSDEELRSLINGVINERTKDSPINPGIMEHYGNAFVGAIAEMMQFELLAFEDEEDAKISAWNTFVIFIEHFNNESAFFAKKEDESEEAEEEAEEEKPSLEIDYSDMNKLADDLSKKSDEELKNFILKSLQIKGVERGYKYVDAEALKKYGPKFINEMVEVFKKKAVTFTSIEDEDALMEAMAEIFFILMKNQKAIEEHEKNPTKELVLESEIGNNKESRTNEALKELILKNATDDEDDSDDNEEEENDDAGSDSIDNFGVWHQRSDEAPVSHEPKRVEVKETKNTSVSSATKELNVPVENLMEYQPDQTLPMYTKPKMSSTRARHVKKTMAEYSPEFIYSHEFERMMKELFLFGPFSKKENEKGEAPIYYIYQKGLDNMVFADTYGGYVDDLITDLIDAYNVYQINETKIENGGMSETQIESLRKSSAIKVEKIFAEMAVRTGDGGVIFEQNDDE